MNSPPWLRKSIDPSESVMELVEGGEGMHRGTIHLRSLPRRGKNIDYLGINQHSERTMKIHHNL